MSSTSDASLLMPPALAGALMTLEPRTAAVLERRLVEDRPLDACARYYGVSREAFSVTLLRAARALASSCGLPARPPVDDDEETTWARQLASALESEAAPGLAALVPTVEVCRRLRAVRAEVRAAKEATEREEADSPRRHREEWIRRIAVAALLALTAYLYLTRPAEPQSRPVYPVPIRH
ncbi:hypothetical protein P2318_12735 [Myxococcaceae bacterium GXIMD 01537]